MKILKKQALISTTNRTLGSEATFCRRKPVGGCLARLQVLSDDYGNHFDVFAILNGGMTLGRGWEVKDNQEFYGKNWIFGDKGLQAWFNSKDFNSSRTRWYIFNLNSLTILDKCDKDLMKYGPHTAVTSGVTQLLYPPEALRDSHEGEHHVMAYINFSLIMNVSIFYMLHFFSTLVFSLYTKNISNFPDNSRTDL